MNRISFSKTIEQFLDGTKTVTRRLGWKTLDPGTRLRDVDKAMGLRKGERARVLGEIVVVSVRRERIDEITSDDVVAEGFPEMTPDEFVAFFCRFAQTRPDDEVTRIEFRRVHHGELHCERTETYECEQCGATCCWCCGGADDSRCDDCIAAEIRAAH